MDARREAIREIATAYHVPAEAVAIMEAHPEYALEGFRTVAMLASCGLTPPAGWAWILQWMHEYIPSPTDP